MEKKIEDVVVGDIQVVDDPVQKNMQIFTTAAKPLEYIKTP